jgi:hypothetical protein
VIASKIFSNSNKVLHCGLGHITVDTCGNLQFHIFLLA